jgi:hypothetical protein
MRTKKYYKNKKSKKSRSKSKKAGGLFNTQKILDISECQPVKQLSEFKSFTADKALELYGKCCPKATLSGKANYNFKCKELYNVYLNKNKNLTNNYLKKNKNFGLSNVEERASTTDEEDSEDSSLQNNNDNIEEQTHEPYFDEDNKYYGPRYGPVQQFPPNPTYIKNLKAYGFDDKYKELSQKYPEESYMPKKEKKWYQVWKGGKKTLRKKTKKLKKY